MPNNIDITKEVVQVAVNYFVEVAKISKMQVGNTRIEEIEQPKEEGNEWKIGISYVEKDPEDAFAALYAKDNRIYKIISVNGETKNVSSMKNG